MDNKILLRFGLPRTGSTLIYNILHDIFPNRRIINSHNLTDPPIKDYDINLYPIIISFREPRDILLSLLRIDNKLDNITKEVIDYWLSRGTFVQSFSQTRAWYKKSNAIFLIYEKFYNNFDYIFDKIEQFFKIGISENRRDKLKKKYNVGNLKKISDSMDNFQQIDKLTLLHGQHISKEYGAKDQWKVYIPLELQDYCTKKLEHIIDFHRQCILDPTL